MNSKPLDAGLAERLKSVWAEAYGKEELDYNAVWEAVAAEVRRIVKEAKEGK